MSPETLKRAGLVLLIAAAGAVAAVAMLGVISSTSGQVGPGTVELRAGPAWSGRTRLSLPPLGAVSAGTHRAPLGLHAEVERIDLDQLQRLLSAADPQARLEAEVERDMRALLRSLVVKALFLAAVVGGVAAALLPGRHVRHLPMGAVGGLAAVALLLLLTWRSYDTGAFAQPRFEGSLQRAPALLRTVGRHVDDLADVRRRIDTLSRELSSLYKTLATPAGPSAGETRLLHVSDMHLNPLGLEFTRQLAERFEVQAVLDTGDLTSFGYPVEARFTELLAGMPVPYLVVPGNHDSAEVRTALSGVAMVRLLDGITEVGGVRILGVPDPTFTADNEVGPEEAAAVKRREAAVVARRVAADDPDVLAVHDPLLAGRSGGGVPLVVAGHVHKRGNTVAGGTRTLTVGSTGATGLGSFTVEGGRAYEAQVLSFAGGRLTAVDYVSFRGIGGSFRVERVVIPAPEETTAATTTSSGVPGTTTPTAAPASSSPTVPG
ncbi:MAG: metallophosphoesterase family protein [Acidimicrobiales bacterium]